MTALFLIAFIAGLLLAVRVMLFGIEPAPARPRPGGAERSATSRPRMSLPLAAGFLVAFGVTGYLLDRTAAWTPGPVLGTALAVGAMVGGVARWLAAKSAAMVPEFDIEDERYVLQGHVAQVTAPIDAVGGVGEIAFVVGDEHRLLRARSIDDVAVAAGTEVVIERIEGEVAYVESWLHVEKRL